MNIFDTLIYQPLFNVLAILYQWLGDFGLAVIALTVLIRLLLYPLAAEAIRVQKITARLQPKMKEIQEKYKKDKEKQAMLIMELWKQHKINPISSFVLLLVQLPVLWGLYRLFWNGFENGAASMLYGFVSDPGKINPFFLDYVNLSEAFPTFALAAGILQFFQTKMMMPASLSEDKNKPVNQGEKFAKIMQTQSLYVFPVITVLIFWSLPSALGLYWIASGGFSIAQQYFLLKKIDKEDGAIAA